MRSRHKSLILLLLAALAVVAAPSVSASTHPVHAQHAIVVSVHELASRVGVEIMQSGGNAVDAAVATGFALAVVHSPAGNIGGGGFMLIRMADGKTHFLDYREKAPAAATRDMFLDAQGNVVEGASEIGYKSIGVPGSVAGMVYAEQKYGKLTLKQVMAPAIRAGAGGIRAHLGRGRRSARPPSGGVPGVAARISTERRLLQARRDFPPARPGAHLAADRGEAG